VESARTSSRWYVYFGPEAGFDANVQTTYTKEHPTTSGTWLCVKCCYALNIDPFAKPKKSAPQKKAATKDARGKVIHYEERKGVTPLGDLCIHVRRVEAKSTDNQMIGKYIEDVDQLGDIGGINMDKVCKIISKSRRL
jgi:DNA repair protein RAD7